MEIVIAICAIILGLIVGFVAGKNFAPKNDPENGQLKLEIGQLKTLLTEKEANFEKVSAAQRASYEENMRIEREANARLIEEMEKSRQEALKALNDRFAESSKALSEQLKVTTEEMLKQRQAEFSESSGEKISQILEPLKISLKAMQEKVNENTAQHLELGGRLSHGIKSLLDQTESARASADKLASLLKGNSKHQGEWGERILKEILESLNLKEGIHFDVQQTLSDETGHALRNEEGKMGRPDVILHLDENKDVIIDSKVSLSAYLDYQDADNEEDRQEALRKHITSLERHVAELVKKDYSGYVSKPRVRLGYVIMFVPNTSALLLATKEKPTLWRDAMEKNVYIADEQTLYAALKIVSLTWQQITQNASHAKVFELAEEMIQRVGQFMKSFNEIGDNLSKATKSFEDGKKKLQEGGQSIPKTCSKLIELGARTSKLPKGISFD